MTAQRSETPPVPASVAAPRQEQTDTPTPPRGGKYVGGMFIANPRPTDVIGGMRIEKPIATKVVGGIRVPLEPRKGKIVGGIFIEDPAWQREHVSRTTALEPPVETRTSVNGAKEPGAFGEVQSRAQVNLEAIEPKKPAQDSRNLIEYLNEKLKDAPEVVSFILKPYTVAEYIAKSYPKVKRVIVSIVQQDGQSLLVLTGEGGDWRGGVRIKSLVFANAEGGRLKLVDKDLEYYGLGSLRKDEIEREFENFNDSIKKEIDRAIRQTGYALSGLRLGEEGLEMQVRKWQE